MLSLQVLTGQRNGHSSFTNVELCDFGYDPYRFCGYPPTVEELRQKAASYVGECIENAMDRIAALEKLLNPEENNDV